MSKRRLSKRDRVLLLAIADMLVIIAEKLRQLAESRLRA